VESDNIKVRFYDDTKDQEAVIVLWKLVFALDLPHLDPLASIKRKLNIGDQLFFVAESDNNIAVGTIMVGYDGHRGWIYSLAVDPRQRKKGIGTMLLQHAEKVLKSMNCPKVNLQIETRNKEVVEFYRKNGYQVEERISMGKIL
jgi:ribosomal protein S18 acetylase RimI-like enzyme